MTDSEKANIKAELTNLVIKSNSHLDLTNRKNIDEIINTVNLLYNNIIE